MAPNKLKNGVQNAEKWRQVGKNVRPMLFQQSSYQII